MNTKHSSAILAATLLSTALQAPAATPEPAQRYVSAHAGLNNLSNWPARVNLGGPEVQANLALKRAPNLGLAFGRQYGQARYEAEYQHGRFDIERAAVGSVTEAVDAEGKYDVLTVNALHQLYARGRFSAFGGIGLGVARVELPHIVLARGCRCLGKADKTGFAFQTRIGAEYETGPAGRVYAQLSYMKLPGPVSEGTASVKYRSRSAGVISVGYRHQF